MTHSKSSANDTMVQASPGSTSSGSTVPLTLDALLAKSGTVEIREGTLADWMLAVQKGWSGLNILYDNEALQRIQYTGRLADTPLKSILDTILPPNNFHYRRQGNALVILPLEEFGEGGDPNQQRTLIRIEYVHPQEAEPSLRHLLSPKGKVFPVPSARAMMVVDYADNVALVREHLTELDKLARQDWEKQQELKQQEQQRVSAAPPVATELQPPGTFGPSMPNLMPEIQPVDQTITTVLWPKFVLAKNIIVGVQSQIADGTVTAIDDMNALVVTGSESAVRSATQLVKQLDVVRKQVRITVLMYDIRVDALEQLGMNWRHAAKGRLTANGIPRDLLDMHSSPLPLAASARAASAANATSSALGAAAGATGAGATAVGGAAAGAGNFVTAAAPNLIGSALTLTHLSRHFDLSAVVLALDQTDGARLLARPSVTCYDRLESEIKIISEIPVQELTQTEMGGNIGTTAFREAGVTLRVTPWIGDDGLVLLKLAPEFSLLTGFSQTGQPLIDRRQQTGQVMVQTGETLVLGGLRRRGELETVSGIPGLMNLKYVGLLFRSHRTTIEESELITFIHTEVVDTDYHGMLREQVAAQIVEETLDRIPIAGHAPYTPPCNDPYCPIHNPRPKYWQGSMLSPDGYVPGQRAGAPPILQPDYSREFPGSPHEPLPPAAAPATAPEPPVESRVPPVQVDVTAERPWSQGEIVLHRLPRVERASYIQRLPTVPTQPLVAPPVGGWQVSPPTSPATSHTKRPTAWQQLLR